MDIICDLGLVIAVIILAVSNDSLRHRIEKLEDDNRHLDKRCDNIAELYRILCKDLLK